MSNKLPEEVQKIIDQLDLHIDDYKKIMHLLEMDMDKGLSAATHDQAIVKMFPSYVTKLPTGKEEGQFLALDLGGTNYRVLLVTLQPNVKPKIIETTYAIPQDKMCGKGEDLFEYIAQTLLDFVEIHKVEKWPINLGFTFSFPCSQLSLNNAQLVRWTKGFSATGCEGQNVAELLQNAIDKLKLDVKCVAVVNDTVGTLTSCALQDSKCWVGVIVGRGTNASYVENINKVETFRESKEGLNYVVINMEWGAFGEDGSLDEFRTEYDKLLDAQSLYPKQQIFEKMCSGMYLGELVRIILLDLVSKKVMFRGEIPQSLKTPETFHTKYLSEVERDPPHLYYCTHYMLNEDLNVSSFEDIDAQIVRVICEKVATRAAYMIGTGIACLLNRINRREITVGIDGSLFKFHTKFPERMTDIVHQLKRGDIKFVLKLSEDGSGKGAAAIAALANRD